MITIEQLLESVYLDFEPRWVTKDEDGEIWVWSGKPDNILMADIWRVGAKSSYRGTYIGCLKLSEFDGKDWTDCIYEVPQKDNRED